MNKRILKKLCKRAAPLMIQAGDHRKQFRSGESGFWPSWSRKGMDRKSYPRPACFEWFDPLKGTIGIGENTGGYEPEWYDEPAYSALESFVFYQFCDWTIRPGATGWPQPTAKIKNPSDLFRYAAKALAA